jgi:hypothetical protein
LTSLGRVCQGEQAPAERPPVEEVPIVSRWTYVTTPTPFGAGGDVCPGTATLGVRNRHLRIVTAMSVGVAAVAGGGQDGPEAFAAARREVPT